MNHQKPFHSAVNQSQQVPPIEHSNPLYFKSNTVFINHGGNTAGPENVSRNVVSVTKKKDMMLMKDLSHPGHGYSKALCSKVLYRRLLEVFQFLEDVSTLI